MVRIAMGLEYDGSGFAGWQAQAHARGLQSAVEAALGFVADQPVEAVAAGRTDAGVHATSQVIHFDTSRERSERAWVLGANANLPKEISALWARLVPQDFHARYSAQRRHYRYRILNQPQRPALERDRVCWIRHALDAGPMHEAAQALIGEHDFSSFRDAECQSRTPMRRLYEIAVRREQQYLVIDVVANAFLHHMVRNIAGVLIAIGRGGRPVAWAGQVLRARDRTQAGVTAVAHGLYLVGVKYHDALELPSGTCILSQ